MSMLDFGILGMNARNLQYIKKFNPQKAIRLADNKFRTKRFLGERGIPVPETYDLIHNRERLYTYDFSSLPHDDFIVKPVRGSRGRGIYRVKLIDGQPDVSYLNKLNTFDRLFTKHSPYLYQWYKILGDYVDDTTFRRYLLDILDGKNSMTTRGDSIMLEETLIPGSGFETYCEHGLADIRVIVFNLIPVAAMLRVPTAESDGKANLDRGALGMGVEVGSGKIYAMYQEGKIYTKNFPDPYGSFLHQYLPYREDILGYSSQIQYFANLGYLALDRVITDEGPKLLEINARAGLKFQNASLLPLRKRLNRIKDVHVSSPEKGVEIAQTLFAKQKTQVVTDSKVLYLRQDGFLDIIGDDKKHRFEVTVDIDLQKKRNYISKNLFTKLSEISSSTVLHIERKGIKFEQLKWKELDKTDKNKIVLGREAVANYFIKPIEKATLTLDFINSAYIQKNEVDKLHLLDTSLGRIGRILNLSKYLRPTNLLEQLDDFVTRGGSYNPQFTYKLPSDQKLMELRGELQFIQDEYFGANGLESKFAQLFLEKTHELQTKLDLIDAYKNQHYAAIAAGNQAMYGTFDPILLQRSKDIIFTHEQQNNDALGRTLRSRELRQRILAYLKEQGLDNVKVAFDQSSVARMTVSKGKHVTIKISPNAEFREHELRATLAHEIDVHVRRYMNGMQSGRQIMKGGTAGYITDEEGLAVEVSRGYLPEGYEAKRMYYRYFFLEQGQDKDFKELAALVRGLHGYDLARTFNETLRMKKGIQDTSVKNIGTLYIKDKIYLDGYERVHDWIEKGGDTEQLMVGKVKISDLAYIV